MTHAIETQDPRPRRVPLLVVGGGLGGVAAALAAVRTGTPVVLTEEFSWLGGQATSQGVPLDEHPWIESIGATRTYRQFRDGIRAFVRRAYPLTPDARARAELNPGAGWVSKVCAEPKAALAAIEEMLAPWTSTRRIEVLLNHVPIGCVIRDGIIDSVEFRTATGTLVTIAADSVIDATETGELLALGDIEHVTGAESQATFGEPSAAVVADPGNMQAASVCFALDHMAGEDHTIERPADYRLWRDFEPEFWGAPLLSWTAPDPRTLVPYTRTFVPNPGDDVRAVVADQSLSAGDSNLWAFRRILARDNLEPDFAPSDITLVNWPQIDYFRAPLIHDDPVVREERLEEARGLSLSMLYWMQTEAPRPDGGHGWPGLRLRPDVMGTVDGLAMAPYHRESRRIIGLTTVTELDVSADLRPGGRARPFDDSVGIGMYRIDLHPSTSGDNYIDVPAAPFQIPLGALIPRRATNLLAACKNVSTTHITNGCYRLHPVEWNIGEVAGLLVSFCRASGLHPHEVRNEPARLREFQDLVRAQGIETSWPDWVASY